MNNRTKIFLEPDYMIRNGPRLGCFVKWQLWHGCHVITNLVFVVFNQGAEISGSERQTEPARVKFRPRAS